MLSKGKKFAASAIALAGLGAGVVGGSAVAFAQPAAGGAQATQSGSTVEGGGVQEVKKPAEVAPTTPADGAAQGAGGAQEVSVAPVVAPAPNSAQGVIPGFAGVYTFDVNAADKNAAPKDVVSSILDTVNGKSDDKGKEKKITAGVDTDGHGLNQNTVHIYYDWLNQEFQDRLTGVKAYQTKVEAMRPGKSVDNPFSGQKVTDKAAGLAEAETMLKAAKDEFAAVDQGYKEDSNNIPQGMKELYVKYVKEKADQARKNVDAATQGDGGIQALAYRELQTQGLEKILKQKEFSVDGVAVEAAVKVAGESPEGKAELKIVAPGSGSDKSEKGWLFVTKGEAKAPQQVNVKPAEPAANGEQPK